MKDNKLEKKYRYLQSKLDRLEKRVGFYESNQGEKLNRKDTISIITSIIATIVAVIAVFISVYIANEQNKVALFEKRYEVVSELKAVITFVNDYNETQRIGFEGLNYIYDVEQGVKGIPEGEYYCSLWKGKFMEKRYDTVDDVGKIIEYQRAKIAQIPYLFEGISDEEAERINDFFGNYAFYTQMYVQISEADYYLQFETPQMERLDCTIEDILIDLEKQIRLK